MAEAEKILNNFSMVRNIQIIIIILILLFLTWIFINNFALLLIKKDAKKIKFFDLLLPGVIFILVIMGISIKFSDSYYDQLNKFALDNYNIYAPYITEFKYNDEDNTYIFYFGDSKKDLRVRNLQTEEIVLDDISESYYKLSKYEYQNKEYLKLIHYVPKSESIKQDSSFKELIESNNISIKKNN